MTHNVCYLIESGYSHSGVCISTGLAYSHSWWYSISNRWR